MSYEIVDADYVLEHLGKMPILDVRPKDMYLESRIPGALSAPLLEAKEAPEDTTRVLPARGSRRGDRSHQGLHCLLL